MVVRSQPRCTAHDPVELWPYQLTPYVVFWCFKSNGESQGWPLVAGAYQVCGETLKEAIDRVMESAPPQLVAGVIGFAREAVENDNTGCGVVVYSVPMVIGDLLGLVKSETVEPGKSLAAESRRLFLDKVKSSGPIYAGWHVYVDNNSRLAADVVFREIADALLGNDAFNRLRNRGYIPYGFFKYDPAYVAREQRAIAKRLRDNERAQARYELKRAKREPIVAVSALSDLLHSLAFCCVEHIVSIRRFYFLRGPHDKRLEKIQKFFRLLETDPARAAHFRKTDNAYRHLLDTAWAARKSKEMELQPWFKPTLEWVRKERRKRAKLMRASNPETGGHCDPVRSA